MFNLAACLIVFGRYITVTCRYIDQSFVSVRLVLAFDQMNAAHTGENIQKHILQVCEDFEIVDRVISIVLDNAGNNNTAIAAHLRIPDLPFNGRFLHQRCLSHVLNIVVQQALTACKDALRNLRHCLKHVKSPKQTNFFTYIIENYAIDLMGVARPKLDVQHRWNATYETIEKSIQFKRVINQYIADFKGIDTHGHAIVLEPITEAHWKQLESLRDFLSSFNDFTNILNVSDSYPSITKAYHVAVQVKNLINSHLADKVGVAEDVVDAALEGTDDVVAAAAARCLPRVNKYFSNIPDVFRIGIMLDPRYRGWWLDNEAERIAWKKLLKEVYLTHYAHLPVSNDFAVTYPYPKHSESIVSTSSVEVNATNGASSSSSSSSNAAASQRMLDSGSATRFRSPFDWTNTGVRVDATGENITTEVDLYWDENESTMADAHKDKEFKVLKWWAAVSKVRPRLALMARHFLGIETTNINGESTFSRGNALITDDRSSLSPKSIRALILTECMY